MLLFYSLKNTKRPVILH